MKVCTDDFTPATSDEKVGIEALEQYLPELCEEITMRRRRSQYWDLTGGAEDGIVNENDTDARANEDASTEAPSESERQISTATSSALTRSRVSAIESDAGEAVRQVRARTEAGPPAQNNASADGATDKRKEQPVTGIVEQPSRVQRFIEQ